MNSPMTRHLCQVRTRAKPQVFLREYTVEALDWYYARHKAADLFRDEPTYEEILKAHNITRSEWWVDSVEV